MAKTLTYPTADEIKLATRKTYAHIYLDPTTRTLYVGRDPRAADHATVCSPARRADSGGLLTAIRSCDAEISALADCYVDGRWDHERRRECVRLLNCALWAAVLAYAARMERARRGL